MSARPIPPARSRLHRLAASAWLRPFNDPQAIDDVLGRCNRLWSTHRIRARVVETIDETADTRTFVLRPNRHWRGARAGQHLLVEVEIDGVRHQRAFSLSAPSLRGDAIRLTVKRQPHGRVTAWMHDRLGIGSVLTLTPASGEFVLPATLPDRILMVAAGSGITPVNAMLHALHARDYTGDVKLVQASRGVGNTIFGDRLQALAEAWPALTRIAHRSAVSGRLDAVALSALVPDHLERETWMCGPHALMDWMDAHYRAAGASHRLRCERFGLHPRPPTAEDAQARVHCAVSAQAFDAAGGRTLLAAAEAAGMQPRHGCRIGICKTCQCRKRSGVVENLLTGQVSSAPGELIQLCISAARSDLELEL